MPDLPADAGIVLTGLARRAIEAALGGGPRPAYEPGWLTEPGAAFVTLTQGERLRGCIGSLTAYRPLGDDVVDNAVAAATRDPRFPAMTAEELGRTHVEVSVLSAPEPFPVTSETDALARLRPGVDGVILTYGSHRGTFLPQVWEQLPGPADFLTQLKRKAGLPADWWDLGVRLERYTATPFHEEEP